MMHGHTYIKFEIIVFVLLRIFYFDYFSSLIYCVFLMHDSYYRKEWQPNQSFDIASLEHLKLNFLVYWIVWNLAAKLKCNFPDHVVRKL